ncbi:MAG TPA: ribosome maturation factor RimP [Pseudogracilibacillus sp.]|nr:ribosome maturation factor RimP [Pseudogracilibacillus sp.]
MSKVNLKEIEEMITPILEATSVELSDIEYVRHGKEAFLQIYIDKDGGVDLNDCSIVSEKISELLDQNDPIKEAYFLEVSSPGAEKPLKTKEDFEKHVNDNIFVSLYVHVGDDKKYEGVLKSFQNDIVTIEYKWKHTTKQVDIPFDKIAKARLTVML